MKAIKCSKHGLQPTKRTYLEMVAELRSKDEDR